MSGVRTPDGLKAIARISVRDSASVSKAVAAAHIRDADNTLRDLASVGGMTVTAVPDSAFGYGNSHAPITISTGTVTANVTGGTPASYLWSADTSDMEAISPTSPTTAFRSTGGVGPGDSVSDTLICTVTDTHGNSAQSNPVSATASNFGT